MLKGSTWNSNYYWEGTAIESEKYRKERSRESVKPKSLVWELYHTKHSNLTRLLIYYIHSQCFTLQNYSPSHLPHTEHIFISQVPKQIQISILRFSYTKNSTGCALQVYSLTLLRSVVYPAPQEEGGCPSVPVHTHYFLIALKE